MIDQLEPDSAQVDRPWPATTTYEVASSEADIEAWRPWWTSLPIGNIDATLDYFLTVVRADPGVRRPHAVRVTVAGQPPVLVVARITDERFPLGVGGARMGSIHAKAVVVAFDGVVGAQTPAQRKAVLEAVEDVLSSGTADVAIFQQLDRASELFKDLDRMRERWRLRRRPAVVWRHTDLPGSWDQFLARRSSKSRRQLRYDDNKMQRTYGDRLVLRRLDEPEHAERLLPDLRAVASVSYQAGLGVSLVDGPVQAALLDKAREEGWLRVWMLYIDDAPVAFWWGVVRAGVLSIGSPGFSPAFARDRVGYYTMRRMLEDASNDPLITRIDYGPGDSDYKERFSTGFCVTSDVYLAARRPRGVAAVAVLRTQDRALRLARDLVDRGGRANELRSWWRARHAPSPGGATDDA